jgi:hypothetical protein
LEIRSLDKIDMKRFRNVSRLVERAIARAKKSFPSKWTALNQFHEIKFISSMYIWVFLVPALAKFLSAVGDMASVTIFEYSFELQLTLPFSWKVFYFSALCFAIANLIYRIRCPKLIQEYPTYSSFKREGKPEWHLRDYANDIGINYEEYLRNHAQQMEDAEHAVVVGEKWTQSIFWHFIWEADRRRKYAQFGSAIFYILGFILIGWVVIENCYWVSKAIFFGA